jgi:hypothetical protein
MSACAAGTSHLGATAAALDGQHDIRARIFHSWIVVYLCDSIFTINTSSNECERIKIGVIMQKLEIRDSEEYGRVVRARRKSLGYTQQQVIDLAPFGSTFLSDLENGKESAQLNKAIAAARMLGLKVIIESPTNLDVPAYTPAGLVEENAN